MSFFQSLAVKMSLRITRGAHNNGGEDSSDIHIFYSYALESCSDASRPVQSRGGSWAPQVGDATLGVSWRFLRQ